MVTSECELFVLLFLCHWLNSLGIIVTFQPPTYPSISYLIHLPVIYVGFFLSSFLAPLHLRFLSLYTRSMYLISWLIIGGHSGHQKACYQSPRTSRRRSIHYIGMQGRETWRLSPAVCGQPRGQIGGWPGKVYEADFDFAGEWRPCGVAIAHVQTKATQRCQL